MKAHGMQAQRIFQKTRELLLQFFSLRGFPMRPKWNTWSAKPVPARAIRRLPKNP